MYATTVRQLVRAPRSEVFGLLLDPGAIGRWRVPDGMRGHVHLFEAREGGRFRVSLTYDEPGHVGKSSDRTDTYAGTFTSVVPDREVVETLHFEAGDAELAAEMTMTTRLLDHPDGTTVEMVHEGVPDAVPPADNEAGMRMALARLARLVETGFA